MLLIRDGIVLTMNQSLEVIQKGSVLIQGETIKAVGASDKLAQISGVTKTIDAGGKLVLPGLINAHVHLLHCLVRGLCADKDLIEYMERCAGPNYSTIDEHEAYSGAMLGCIEAIKSGTTCVLDNSCPAADRWLPVTHQLLTAFQESGLRAVAAPAYVDQPGPFLPPTFQDLLRPTHRVIADYEALYRDWHDQAESRIRIWVSPNNLLYCTTESITALAHLAETHDAGIHTHTSESRQQDKMFKERFGASYVSTFASLGILRDKFHVVHGVWLDDDDIRYIKGANAKIVHNPESNMILSSGIAPVTKFLQNGITVALGCDAVICNNNLDMIECMRFAALLQKVSTLQPTSISAWDVLKMATIDGARALGMADQLGSIEAGKKADIIIVDCNTPNMVPLHDPVANLVYSANAGNVSTVIVNGRILMENRTLTLLDEEKCLASARENASTLLKRMADKGAG